jgi:hypothetical protein
MNKKQAISLTENQLRQIVMESLKKILREDIEQNKQKIQQLSQELLSNHYLKYDRYSEKYWLPIKGTDAYFLVDLTNIDANRLLFAFCEGQGQYQKILTSKIVGTCEEIKQMALNFQMLNNLVNQYRNIKQRNQQS